MKKFYLLLLSILVLNSGCAPVVLFGGAAGSGVVLSKEKTVGSSVDDVNIWSKIKADFLKNQKEIPGILTDISVEVSEGRVLLTGTLDSPEDRLKVLRIVWDQKGVKEVINEIKLSDGGKLGLRQYADDAWITTQVKTKMLGDKEIHTLNYSVETVEKVVYILGVAKNEEELRHVIDAADSVKGVEKVNAFVRVADKKIQVEANEIHESNPHTSKPKSNIENIDEEEVIPTKENDKVKYISPVEEEIVTLGENED